MSVAFYIDHLKNTACKGENIFPNFLFVGFVVDFMAQICIQLAAYLAAFCLEFVVNFRHAFAEIADGIHVTCNQQQRNVFGCVGNAVFA